VLKVLQLRRFAGLRILPGPRYFCSRHANAAIFHRVRSKHGSDLCAAMILASATVLSCLSQSIPANSPSEHPVTDHSAAVTASFEDPNLVLQEGQTNGSVRFWVKFDHLPSNSPLASLKPDLKDRSAEGGDLRVTFVPIEKGASTADSMEWKFEAAVAGLPLKSSVKRKAAILLGDSVNILVEYALTNLGQGTFTWSVKGPPDQWVLDANPEISLVVITGDRPARNLRLVQSSLQDANTKRQISANQLILCQPDEASCREEAVKRCVNSGSASSIASPKAGVATSGSANSVGDVPPRHATPVSLSVCHNFSDAGVFAGSITLATDEDSSTQAVNLTVLASSQAVRFVGFLAIVGGIILWMFSTLLLRRNFNRNQLLLPFAELHDTITSLRATVLKAKAVPGANFDSVLAQLSALDACLTEQSLSDVLPSSLPSLLSNDSAVSPAYQQRLADLTEKVGAQSIVVQGISVAASKWTDDPTQKPQILAALQSLNNLDRPPSPVGSQANAQNQVTSILGTMTAALRTSLDATASASTPRPLPTSREILIRNQRLNYVAWCVWLVLTVAVGYFVMIASLPGFGTWIDLWKCFFWGLGIPVIGQQLQQLNPTTVSNVLSYSIPKT
jgi:hypothetical protein